MNVKVVQVILGQALTEIETQSYVSRSLGKKTILVSSSNQSHGIQHKDFSVFNSSNKQESDSVSETGRPLLTEDELGAIGDKVIIAFVKGNRPIICHKATYFDDKAWHGLWDRNPIENNSLTINFAVD